MRKLFILVISLLLCVQSARAALSGWSDANYVEHGSAAALDDMTVGALAFWCYTTSSTARQVLWSKNTGGGANSFTLAEQATPSIFEWQKVRATTANSITAALTNFSNYAINKWIFVVVNFDTVTAANNTIWVGDASNPAGQPVSYSAQTAGSGALTTDAANNWRVGRHAAATGRQFVGSIGNHYAFSSILAEGQIYELQWTGRVVGLTELISTQYGFGGATGTQADWSGQKNNGTVTGTPTVAAHVPMGPLFGFDDFIYQEASTVTCPKTLLTLGVGC